MEKIEIYFQDDSELAEYEAINKGYRHDVFVKVNKEIFNVRVYSLIRLQEDFESEIETYGFYAVEPNLILVNDTNKEEIVSTINRLFQQCYFTEIKPENSIQLNQLKKVQ